MKNRFFLPDVAGVRKSFTEYREQLQELLIKSYSLEMEVVNKIIDLQSVLFDINSNIEDGKV